jgi:hypothetical protein
MALDFTLNGGPVNVAGAVHLLTSQRLRHTPVTPDREPTVR